MVELVQICEHNYKLNQKLNRVNVMRIPMRNVDRLLILLINYAKQYIMLSIR